MDQPVAWGGGWWVCGSWGGAVSVRREKFYPKTTTPDPNPILAVGLGVGVRRLDCPFQQVSTLKV